MFIYYIRLAWHSIKRNPVITGLMVLALALGIGTSISTLTVYYYMASDPIPEKSSQLFGVQVDSFDPEWEEPTEGPRDLGREFTYTDAQNLMRLESPAKNQVAHYRSSGLVKPEDEDLEPFRAEIRATYRSFFPMFNVPFKYGDRWTEASDDNGEQVVVLSSRMNERLFAGEDSVGRQFKVDDLYYRVVGVLDEWEPTLIFYNSRVNVGQRTADMFAPFNHFATLEPFGLNGSISCWKSTDGNTHADFLNSECSWVIFWAELEDEQQQQEYLAFLDNYANSQRELGRFQRPNNNFISNVGEWLELSEVVGTDNKMLVGLSFLFLLVCLINTIGLLIAKFFGKSSEVSVRRALGASKSDIFTQNIIEVGLIGLAGGALGLGMAWLGLRGINTLYRGYDKLVNLDFTLIVAALVIAVVGSILAGIYPSWRASNLAPSQYLKTQ